MFVQNMKTCAFIFFLFYFYCFSPSRNPKSWGRVHHQWFFFCFSLFSFSLSLPSFLVSFFCFSKGKKWWTSGAGDPRCKICIFMGKTYSPGGTEGEQSMILIPMNFSVSWWWCFVVLLLYSFSFEFWVTFVFK